MSVATTLSPSVGSTATGTRIHSAEVSSHGLGSSVSVVTASGEIDAVNADMFAQYVVNSTGADCAAQRRSLIVDLSRLKFFGIEGFSALQTINARCASLGVSWAVVPSAEVSRVLRICDTEAALPSVATVETPRAAQQCEPRTLLQLVTQSR